MPLTTEQLERATNVRNFLRENAHGKIFSVKFIKRSTGEERHMTCRLDVQKYLQGGEQGYNPAEHGLLTVYDLSKNGYRSIACEAVTEIKLAGETYQTQES